MNNHRTGGSSGGGNSRGGVPQGGTRGGGSGGNTKGSGGHSGSRTGVYNNPNTRDAPTNSSGPRGGGNAPPISGDKTK